MKLSISDKCTGHGRCYTLAPELTEEDDEGYGAVKTADIAPDRETLAKTIVDACPERAVSLS